MDLGPYFLFFVLPIALLLFRRGVLLNLAVLALLPSVLLHPQPALATPDIEDYADVLKTQDQLGYDAWQKQNYGAAEAQFNHPQWRASALYRQGKYAEAIPLFARDKSAQGFYNLGNAKAMVGDLEGAKKAYKEALQKAPNDAKVAENLAVIENLLAQQKAQQQQAQQNQSQQGQQGQKQQQSSGSTKKEDEASKQKSQSDKANNNASEQDSKGKSANASKQNQGDNKNNNQNDNQSNQNANQNKAQSKSASSQSAQDAANQSGQQGKQAQQNQNSAASQNQSQGQQGLQNEPSAAEHAKRNQAQENSQQPPQGVAESQTSGESGAEQKRLSPEKLAEQDSDKNQASTDKAGSGAGNQSGQSTPNKLSEKQQAQKNWLKQIPDQPGLFLQRKFEYQFQQSRQKASPNDKQW